LYKKTFLFDLKKLKKFSYDFSNSIKNPSTIFLRGTLGSGKTTFARLLIQQLYLKEKKTPPIIIPSPSFSILQVYNINKNIINHYDFYRIKKIEEIIELNLEENILNSIVIIEWPEILLSKLKINNAIDIDIKIVNKNIRKFNIKSNQKL
tara:strand:+ start:86 stop:535 length:450 start_codon:yes stop_codon:yes gene_type:complete